MARVWCLTPNPVLESKFIFGRAGVSAGGKGHNVAKQLKRWGVPTISLVPRAGSDWLEAARKDGVEIRLLPVMAAARDGYATVERPGNRLDFFTPDPVWSARDWQKVSGFLTSRTGKGDWLVVAGSAPKQSRSGWWRNLFQALRKKGVRLVVDSRGTVLREALVAGVDWAKANLAEAEGTVNRRGVNGCLAGMRRIARGRSGLFITLGSRGLVVQRGAKKIAVSAPKIRVWDATGSGDVVTAALLYGICRGWGMAQVAGFAVWAGSEHAARRDAVVARLKRRGVFA